MSHSGDGPALFHPFRFVSRRSRALRSLLLAGVLAASATLGTVGAGTVAQAGTVAHASTSLCPGATVPVFGPNVCVFTPTMPQATIQSDLDAIAAQQVPGSAQFGSGRYAILF